MEHDPGGATSPGQILLQYFEREQTRIDVRRDDLAQARALLAQFLGQAAGDSIPGVELVSESLAPLVVQRLVSEANGITRTVIRDIQSGPGLDDATRRTNQHWLAEGNVQRAIYASEVLESTDGLRWIRAWGSIGEVQRVAPEVDSEYAIFGTAGAVSLSRWGDGTSGYVVIRDPLFLATLTAHFELAWSRAHSVPVSSAKNVDQRLVELLGMGLKDEAIGRFLGISLRTVRRRIAGLMGQHSVDTRFQLGAALARAEMMDSER